jgi:hypothetical protein
MIYRLLITLIIFTASVTNLSAQNNDSSSYNCIENKDFSNGGNICLDCFDTDSSLVRQINKDLYIHNELINGDNTQYIHLNSETNNKELIGYYKQGKPFNGFFINKKASDNQWLMYDYYKDGKFVYQIYNNAFDNLKQEDTPLVYRAITSKNTFEGETLTNGIELVLDENTTGRNGSYQLIRKVKDSQTVSYEIGIFGMHFGEIFSIIPIENGYLFDSYMRNKIKITYTENGRNHEYFDSENNYLFTINYEYIPINERDSTLDSTTEAVYNSPYGYLRHKGTLCFPKISGMNKLSEYRDSNENPDKDLSKVLEMFTRNIFTHYRLIVNEDFTSMLRSSFWADDDSLDLFRYIKNLNYDYRYKEGEIVGTYSLELYDDDLDGSITNSDIIEIKNKTVDEIATILQGISNESDQQQNDLNSK